MVENDWLIHRDQLEAGKRRGEAHHYRQIDLAGEPALERLCTDAVTVPICCDWMNPMLVADETWQRCENCRKEET